MAPARLTYLLLISLAVVGGQPLDTMLVLETSPGTEQAIGLIRPRVLHEDDRAGVIGFFRTAHLLQPLTESREDLAAVLQLAGSRVGAAVGGPDRGRLNSNLTVDLVDALKLASSELGQHGANERKRAIVVLFAGEDPNLSPHLDALQRMLSAVDARLYAVVVQRIDGTGPLAVPRTGVPRFPVPSPVMTAQFVSQLVEESGGRIFRRNWNLKEILAQARKP